MSGQFRSLRFQIGELCSAAFTGMWSNPIPRSEAFSGNSCATCDCAFLSLMHFTVRTVKKDRRRLQFTEQRGLLLQTLCGLCSNFLSFNSFIEGLIPAWTHFYCTVWNEPFLFSFCRASLSCQTLIQQLCLREWALSARRIISLRYEFA